uniref:Uncharacterized protein n=1 Tax=Anguilla anguilla TaxID=7936 RepID=A0A0E9QU85_ANGAN
MTTTAWLTLALPRPGFPSFVSILLTNIMQLVCFFSWVISHFDGFIENPCCVDVFDVPGSSRLPL